MKEYRSHLLGPDGLIKGRVDFLGRMRARRKNERPPSSHCNITLCCQRQMNNAGAHLSTKQAHLLRILFSIGLTAVIGAGTFVVIRYLTKLSE